MGSQEVPFEIDDREIIVRAVFYPKHCNRKKLKAGAFKSAANKDEVSVIRHDYVDADTCKTKAKELEASESSKPGMKKEYTGFAVLRAKEVRDSGSQVKDSREVFLGHADLVHGYITVPNEPLPPLINQRLDELATIARFVKDPDPESPCWMGLALR